MQFLSGAFDAVHDLRRPGEVVLQKRLLKEVQLVLQFGKAQAASLSFKGMGQPEALRSAVAADPLSDLVEAFAQVAYKIGANGASVDHCQNPVARMRFFLKSKGCRSIAHGKNNFRDATVCDDR